MVASRKLGSMGYRIAAVVVAVIFCSSASAKPPDKDVAATQVMKSLRNAQEAYRVKHKAYGTLDQLKADGYSPVGENEVEAASGYRFRSKAAGDRYTISATPPVATMRTYRLVETGVITPSPPGGAPVKPSVPSARRNPDPQAAAVQILKSLRNAQEAYRVKHKVYGTVSQLKAEGSSPVGDGEKEGASGYRFSCALGKDKLTYVITATPPAKGMTTYTLDGRGVITPPTKQAPAGPGRKGKPAGR